MKINDKNMISKQLYTGEKGNKNKFVRKVSVKKRNYGRNEKKIVKLHQIVEKKDKNNLQLNKYLNISGTFEEMKHESSYEKSMSKPKKKM